MCCCGTTPLLPPPPSLSTPLLLPSSLPLYLSLAFKLVDRCFLRSLCMGITTLRVEPKLKRCRSSHAKSVYICRCMCESPPQTCLCGEGRSSTQEISCNNIIYRYRYPWYYTLISVAILVLSVHYHTCSAYQSNLTFQSNLTARA